MIQDKNSALVELLSGEVRVNDMLMGYAGGLIGYAPDDNLVMISADSICKYDVMLADGAHYIAAITSQPQLLEYSGGDLGRSTGLRPLGADLLRGIRRRSS